MSKTIQKSQKEWSKSKNQKNIFSVYLSSDGNHLKCRLYNGYNGISFNSIFLTGVASWLYYTIAIYQAVCYSIWWSDIRKSDSFNIWKNSEERNIYPMDKCSGNLLFRTITNIRTDNLFQEIL